MSTIDGTTIGSGIVLGTVTGSGTYASPLTITSTGAIEVIGGNAAITEYAGYELLSVINQGTITAAASDGIEFGNGGYLNNSGFIRGTLGVGDYSIAGIIINSGTIIGNGTGVSDNSAIEFHYGGSIDNSGRLLGYRGVNAYVAAATISNTGTIASSGTGISAVGVYLKAGGNIANTGTAVISGYYGAIEASTATITNSGTLMETGNYGRNVFLTGGGSITNTGTGLIQGHAAIFSNGAGSVVVNDATIIGTGTSGVGVFLPSGGSVSNTGLIQAYGPAVYIGLNAGTVSNSGTIEGTAGIGVNLQAGGTIINSGTIGGVGGTAVNIGGSGGNRLELAPGYSFGGTVVVAGTANTLELSGTAAGTFSGIGSRFTNFSSVTVDAGAHWTLTGANTIGSGVTFSDLGALTNSGTLTGSGTFIVDPATLGNSGSIELTVTLTGGGYLGNTGAIAGAGGGDGGLGYNGGPGGTGGPGIISVSGGSISNSAAVAGGTGGLGGGSSGGTIGIGGGGGAGGAGIYMTAGGGITNLGVVEGGTGGAGGYAEGYEGFGGNGGNGGGGIYLATGGRITNLGTVEGGTGGFGGYALGANSVGGNGGAGGVGIYLAAGGTIINGGTVEGGAGGAGATGGAVVGFRGEAGVGIRLAQGGTVINGGPGTAGALVLGPIGVVAYGTTGATVVDYGTISGGSGIAIYLHGTGANLLALGHGYQLTGVVIGSAAVGASNTLELLGTVGAAVTVNYGALGLTNFGDVLFGPGGHATLDVEQTSGTFGLVVSGFSLGNEVIDLTQIGINGTVSNFDSVTHRMTVTGSDGTVTLQLDGTDGSLFATHSDGGTGIDVTVACFARGTRILTPEGEAAIEDLAIGVKVMTISGAAKPVKWVGHRAYDGRFIVGNRDVLPIRVSAGALADGVPVRDLLVSPDHSLYIDGVLVAARQLLNGATITQETAVERLEYFHIELEAHDIIFADGTPAESYVECDNRGRFHNAAEFALLYPAGDHPQWQFCAPLLQWDSEEPNTIREALMQRAKALGHRLDLNPDLHLVVDGAVVQPDSVDGRVYRFLIPAGSAAASLASRSAVPAEIRANARDLRRLGVPVERLVLHDVDLRIEAAHGHPGLSEGEGFHDAEPSHRWTDGLASLPENWLRAFPGEFTLEVHLIPSDLPYRLPRPARTRAVA